MASLFQHKVSGAWHVVTYLGRENGRIRTATKTFRTEAAARDYMAANGLVHKPRGAAARPMSERIRSLVEVDDNGCWIWQGFIGTHGYGQMNVVAPIGVKRSRSVLAHRMSYETFVGPIPEGLQIDHLCAVTACANPEHLEPVTAQVNTQRRSDRLAVTA